MRLPRSPSWWVVVMLWCAFSFKVLTRPYWNAFAWDSFGYHLYLPALLPNGDPLLRDLSWVQAAHSEHDASPLLYQITERDGHRVVRYTMGLALTWSPWYLMGHGLAKLTGQPADGYSGPYQWCVVCGVLFYFLIGLFWSRRALLSAFSEPVTAITLGVLLMGTNLIEQVLTNITGPHVVLFTLYAGVVHFTVRWHRAHAARDALALAVLCGLAALTRPTDAVSVLIPLLWGEGPRAVIRHGRQFLMVVCVMVLIGLPQLLYWFSATGMLFYDSYGNAGEGLDVLKPHTAAFLFSFRKGWWLYSPIMLVATIGIALLRDRWRMSFWAVSVFFIVNLWLVSSWTCWWYADSFGSRAMTGSYPVMALPLAAVVAWAMETRTRRAPVLASLGVLCGFSLFQYWQFTRGIIHPQRMTRPAYFAVLGRVSRPAGLDDLLLIDRGSPEPDPRTHVRLPAAEALFRPPPTDRDTVAPWIMGALHAIRVDREHPFTPAIRIPYERLTAHDHVWVECAWRVLPLDTAARPWLSVVSAVEHGGRSYSYRAEDLKLGPRIGRWYTVNTFYLTPEVRDRQDTFVTYAWSRDTLPLLIAGPVIHLHEARSPH